MAVNYVKFQRGLQTAYDNLVTSEKVDANTLYFVYESSTATTGKLYLGTKLISDDNAISSASISTLTDVITSTAKSGSFLVQQEDGKWKQTDASDVAKAILANVDKNEFDISTGILQLKDFGTVDPSVGSIFAKVGTDTDGKNVLQWSTVTTSDISDFSDFNTRLTTAETDLSQIKTNINQSVKDALANLNALTYEVADSESAVTELNTIYLIKKADGEEEDKNSYDEFMLLNHINEDGTTSQQVERIGSWAVDLTGFVKTSELDNYITDEDLNTALATKADTSAIGDLNALFNYTSVSETPTTIVDGMNLIYDRLVWKEISE